MVEVHPKQSASIVVLLLTSGDLNLCMEGLLFPTDRSSVRKLVSITGIVFEPVTRINYRSRAKTEYLLEPRLKRT